MKYLNGEFLNRSYNRGVAKKLEIGDIVTVHPATRPDGTLSTAREPCEAEIIFFQDMIGTHVNGGYSAYLNDYLFGRLEFKSRK